MPGNDETHGIGLMVVSATSFGTLGIFGKMAMSAGLPIATVLAFRFGLASLVLWAGLSALGRLRRLHGRNLLYGLLLGGVFYAVQSGLYFVGLAYMTAGLVGIIIYVYPVLVVALSVVLLDEAVTIQVLLSLILAIGGVVLVMGADPEGASVTGVAVVFIAAFVYAGYFVLSHTAVEDVDTQLLTAHVMPAAAVSFLLFGLVSGTIMWPRGGGEWSVLLALALVSTVLPLLAFFAGMRHVGATRASVISSLEPATAVVLGALYLGEPVTLPTVVGGAMIFAGVLLIHLE